MLKGLPLNEPTVLGAIIGGVAVIAAAIIGKQGIRQNNDEDDGNNGSNNKIVKDINAGGNVSIDQSDKG